MTYLGNDDIKKFYRIWFGLLEYVNGKYKVSPGLNFSEISKSVELKKVLPVRDRVWGNDSLIDEFIGVNPYNLDDEEIQILSGWKTRVSGSFVILKQLKNYTILIHIENGGKIYGVTGISEPIPEVIHSCALPVYADMVLVPFGDRIVYDGIVLSYNMKLGSNIRKNINAQYMAVKEKYGIITNL